MLKNYSVVFDIGFQLIRVHQLNNYHGNLVPWGLGFFIYGENYCLQFISP